MTVRMAAALVVPSMKFVISLSVLDYTTDDLLTLSRTLDQISGVEIFEGYGSVAVIVETTHEILPAIKKALPTVVIDLWTPLNLL